VPAVYEIFFPAPPLRPFIECYWFLKARVRPPRQLEEVIFTDARADIVFVYSSPYTRTKATAAGPPQLMGASNLDAQRRYPVRIQQQGDIHLIGVRFRPAGLAAFVPLPVHELAGTTVGLQDAFGPDGAALEGKLYDLEGRGQDLAEGGSGGDGTHGFGAGPQGNKGAQRGPARGRQAQVGLLDSFFLSRLATPPAYEPVAAWMAAIEARQGVVSIAQLSRDSGYSVRTVDRLFRQVVGLSPKFFARTVRFRHVHRELLRQPELAWDAIVAGYGYYDQSHFAKDVAALTGVPPKAYRAYLLAKRSDRPPHHVQFLQDSQAVADLE